MKLISVESSNISAIGFEKDIKLSLNRNPTTRLRITFTHGDSYDYYGVSERLYNDFLKAKSKGKFFHDNINKKYTYEKVK